MMLEFLKETPSYAPTMCSLDRIDKYRVDEEFFSFREKSSPFRYHERKTGKLLPEALL